MKYLWQHKNWPALFWESAPLLPLISRARLGQGKFLTEVTALGFKLIREGKTEWGTLFKNIKNILIRFID